MNKISNIILWIIAIFFSIPFIAFLVVMIISSGEGLDKQTMPKGAFLQSSTLAISKREKLFVKDYHINSLKMDKHIYDNEVEPIFFLEKCWKGNYQPSNLIQQKDTFQYQLLQKKRFKVFTKFKRYYDIIPDSILVELYKQSDALANPIIIDTIYLTSGYNKDVLE